MLDHPLLSQRYFFPRPQRPREDAWEVDTRSGHRLVCLRQERPHHEVTVLYYHGNGEVPADLEGELALDWLRLGLNLVVVPYRGYGGSTGVPQLKAMLEDTQDVFQALGLAPERVVAFGRSLGSLYATELVRRFPGMAGLILESGIANPLERLLLRAEPEELGGTLEELRAQVDAHLNQRAKLSGYAGPVLVMHTLGDDLVDPSHARRLHEWAAGRRRLVLFERGDHNTILGANHERYFLEVARFLEGIEAPWV